MLTTTIDSINYNRARFAREVEYAKESVNEDILDERTEAAESLFIKETPEELMEAVEFGKSLTSEETVAESTEIDRILNADHDLTFEEMCNLEEVADKYL
jgi:hypothetical protein